MSSATDCLKPLALITLIAVASPAAQAAEPAKAEPAKVEKAAPAEPKVERIVVEDDHTKIEELRVRGQTQTATVTPKDSKLPSYEIIMGDGGRDLSAGPGSNRGATGKRVWKLLTF
ncbi:hypothetical protein [Pelomonas sp. SE-A7]|uniref:hypothetical protein n=1 Tax=Pelomonas sp. SE-A7 TaxID=3054953 RepID=UPI00259CA985|nr:hypothetical protein [Pelomonas sp. SE-A7]MDM4767209.1 hypothetical protein [Pelomonas sp. SE-A7]